MLQSRDISWANFRTFESQSLPRSDLTVFVIRALKLSSTNPNPKNCTRQHLGGRASLPQLQTFHFWSPPIILVSALIYDLPCSVTNKLSCNAFPQWNMSFRAIYTCVRESWSIFGPRINYLLRTYALWGESYVLARTVWAPKHRAPVITHFDLGQVQVPAWGPSTFSGGH